MIRAAELAVSIGASLVDINMGCPAKRVVAGACGSALMRETELAQHIVRTVVGAVPASVPVTVKHRAGWDDLHQNAPEFACAMVEAGAKMITVHGRTRAQGFSGESSLDIIRRVRDAVPGAIPVVGNGDVVDVAGYRRMRGETGCDAVMIGRGALGNPWLFREIAALERAASSRLARRRFASASRSSPVTSRSSSSTNAAESSSTRSAKPVLGTPRASPAAMRSAPAFGPSRTSMRSSRPCTATFSELASSERAAA